MRETLLKDYSELAGLTFAYVHGRKLKPEPGASESKAKPYRRALRWHAIAINMHTQYNIDVSAYCNDKSGTPPHSFLIDSYFKQRIDPSDPTLLQHLYGQDDVSVAESGQQWEGDEDDSEDISSHTSHT